MTKGPIPVCRRPMFSKGFSYEVWVDGACANNPGEAGIGIIVNAPGLNYEPVVLAQNIGKATNNIAEIYAIIVGLQTVRRFHPRSIKSYTIVWSDSKYAINTIQGLWQATANLDLINRAKEETEKFQSLLLAWCPGDSNQADILAKHAARRKMPIPGFPKVEITG